MTCGSLPGDGVPGAGVVLAVVPGDGAAGGEDAGAGRRRTEVRNWGT